MKRLLPLLALTLTGCATDRAYYDAVNAATQAQAQAAKERYAAIAAMANSGGDAAKVAAVFALMQSQPQQQTIAPAPTPFDRALQVLQATSSIVSPWIAPVMAYKQVAANGQVAIAQAQANRDVMLGSYTAISSVASNIPQPVTTNTTTTSNTANTTNTATTNTTNTTTTNTKTCTSGAGASGAPGGFGGSVGDAVPQTGAIGGSGGAGGSGAAGGSVSC